MKMIIRNRLILMIKIFCDDDSNDMIMSSLTSTSTTSTSKNTKKIANNAFNELIFKTNKASNSSTVTPSSTQNTFKGNKKILNKSIEEIKNFMQQNETTPSSNNNSNQQIMCNKLKSFKW